MRKILSIFGLYNKKVWKDIIGLIAISIVGIIVSITMMIAVSVYANSYEKISSEKLKVTNGGDINVSAADIFSDEDIERINNLGINIDTQCLWSNQFYSNIYGNDKIGNAVISIYSPNSAYRKLFGEENNNGVMVSEDIAKRMGVKLQDDLFIKVPNSDLSKSYKISKWMTNKQGISLAETDLELSKEILGECVFHATNIDVNTLYININDKSLVASLSEKISNTLGENFKVRTEDRLWKENENKLKLQVQGLRMLGIIAFLFGSISACFSVGLAVLKRRKDFAMLKVLGLTKQKLYVLILLEILLIVLIASIIGVPAGIAATRLLKLKTGLDIQSITSRYIIKVSMEVLLFVILGVLSFSLVLLPVIGQMKENVILRDQRLEGKDKFGIGIYGVLSFLLISGLVCIYIGSPLGILYMLLLVLLCGVIYSLIYLVLSLILIFRKLFKRCMFVTILLLKNRRKTNALISISLFIGLLFMEFTIIMSNHVFTFDYIGENEKSTQISISSDRDSQNIIEDVVLSTNQAIQFDKYRQCTMPLIEVNDNNVRKTIEERYYSSELLQEDYFKYANEALFCGYEKILQPSPYSLKEGRWLSEEDKGKNYIVICNNTLDSVFHLGVGDILKVEKNGREYSLEVIGVLDGKGVWNKSCFGYVSSNTFSEADWDSGLQYILTSQKDINQLGYSLLTKVPDISIENLGDMSIYLDKFVNQQKSLIIYLMFLCLVFSAGLMVCNQISLIMNQKQEFAVISISSGRKSDLFRIQLYEGIILGVINGLLVDRIVQASAFFVLSEIVMIDYENNLLLTLIIVITSTLICVISKIVIQLGMDKKQEVYLLRERV